MTGHRATRALRGVLLLLMGLALAACREDGATYRSDTGVVTARTSARATLWRATRH
jgi:hypothetical protein